MSNSRRAVGNTWSQCASIPDRRAIAIASGTPWNAKRSYLRRNELGKGPFVIARFFKRTDGLKNR
ncbi:hypothetical protein ACW9YQ_16850 (plasmid) [Paraburkholderia strydomiana]